MNDGGVQVTDGIAEKNHVYSPNRVKPLEVPRLESQSLLILLTVGSNKAQSYFVYFLHGGPMIDGVR